MADNDVSVKKTNCGQDQHQQSQHHQHHHSQQPNHHDQQQPELQQERQQQQHHHHNHHHHHHRKHDPQDQRPHHHHHHHHHRQPQHNHHQHHSNDEAAHKRRTTVLIAMDGSPHSFYAFDWYMKHIHKPQNDVLVMHSSHSNQLLSRSEPLLPSVVDAPSPVMSRLASKEEDEVNRIAQMIKGKLTSNGVRGKLVRLTGDPGPAIVELANHHKADCIVTGSRGMGTIKRALIGSVSDYVLHHSTCPVLVCRYKESSNSNSDS